LICVNLIFFFGPRFPSWRGGGLRAGAATTDKARDLPPCISERPKKAGADHDAPAYVRDELEITTARSIQGTLASAVMLSVGAAMPLLMVVVSPANALCRSCLPRWAFSL
jgi:hypothetical protein